MTENAAEKGSQGDNYTQHVILLYPPEVVGPIIEREQEKAMADPTIHFPPIVFRGRLTQDDLDLMGNHPKGIKILNAINGSLERGVSVVLVSEGRGFGLPELKQKLAELKNEQVAQE